MTAQCSPPSVVLNTTFPPSSTSFGSVADTSIGVVQLKRYCRFAGFVSLTPLRYGRIERVRPVFSSRRVIAPFCEST